MQALGRLNKHFPYKNEFDSRAKCDHSNTALWDSLLYNKMYSNTTGKGVGIPYAIVPSRR